VDPGILFRVRGEDRTELGVDLEITGLLSVAVQGKIQDPFLENGEEDIVCLRTGTGEFVIDQRIALFDGNRQPIIDPPLGGLLLDL